MNQNQQARDDRYVRLDFDTVLLRTQQMAATQQLLEHPENNSISHLKRYAAETSSAGISSKSVASRSLPLHDGPVLESVARLPRLVCSDAETVTSRTV